MVQSGSDENVIDELLGLLSSSDRHIRFDAARSLCRMGKNNPKILPALLRLHSDPYFAVRCQVARAVIHLNPEPLNVLPILDQLLQDEDKNVRNYAAEAKAILLGRTPPLPPE